MAKSKERNSPIASRPKIDILEKSMKILQGFAIIIGIWATYNEYKKQNEEKNLLEIERHEQTARAFRKHFYDVQFGLYAEACEVIPFWQQKKLVHWIIQKPVRNFFGSFGADSPLLKKHQSKVEWSNLKTC